MFANFLIGLREGLEAALVVSILIAYLVKADRRDRLPAVGGGVALAIALSVAFGALLTYTSSDILQTFESREIFGGSLSIVAVGFVTWMVFWMRRTARHLRAELHGKLGSAIAVGVFAVALTAFIAVAREGLETALFFWSAVQAAGTTVEPVTGFVLGVLVAVVLAWLLYRRSVTIDLARFFTWTGAALVVVAAGVLAYGIHDLQEGKVLGGLGTLAFDVSSTIPPGSWYGTLLKGTINFTPQTTVAQAIAWAVYLTVVMTLFLGGPAADWVRRRRRGATAGVAAGTLLLAAAVLAGCGSDATTAGGSGKGGDGEKVVVQADDKRCTPSTNTVHAGTSTFTVHNGGSQVTELYVYAAGDRVVSEVEDIGPQTSRDLTVQLPAGAYELACKPGMSGKGIRAPLTVTG